MTRGLGVTFHLLLGLLIAGQVKLRILDFLVSGLCHVNLFPNGKVGDKAVGSADGVRVYHQLCQRHFSCLLECDKYCSDLHLLPCFGTQLVVV